MATHRISSISTLIYTNEDHYSWWLIWYILKSRERMGAEELVDNRILRNTLQVLCDTFIYFKKNILLLLPKSCFIFLKRGFFPTKISRWIFKKHVLYASRTINSMTSKTAAWYIKLQSICFCSNSLYGFKEKVLKSRSWVSLGHWLPQWTILPNISKLCTEDCCKLFFEPKGLDLSLWWLWHVI